MKSPVLSPNQLENMTLIYTKYEIPSLYKMW